MNEDSRQKIVLYEGRGGRMRCGEFVSEDDERLRLLTAPERTVPYTSILQEKKLSPLEACERHNRLLDELEAMKEKAEFLFQLLDDIDTTADMAKGDREAYFQQVERIHKRRFEAATTDGYRVFWDKRETPEPEPVQPSESPG